MRPRYFLLPAWICLCVWLLYSGLSASPPVDVKDLHVGMSVWMLVLTFPLGLIVFVGSEIVTQPFGAYFAIAWAYHPAFFVVVWASFFLVGLFQWLLPPNSALLTDAYFSPLRAQRGAAKRGR